MTLDPREERLNKLEMLFSEQEYTIQILNTIVTRQDDELARLSTRVERLQRQLGDLREQVSDIAPGHDRPPHY